MDAMIPEGLQYQSIEYIVSKIKSVGFNVIRLTFSVEMVDQIIEGGHIAVQASFAKALGELDGEKIWEDIQKKNPSLENEITRLKVCEWSEKRFGSILVTSYWYLTQSLQSARNRES